MSSDRSASQPRGDVVLSGVLFAVFAGVTLRATGYPAPARTLPILIGVAGCVLSAVELARSWRRSAPAAPAVPTPWWPDVVMFAWFAGAVVLVAALGVLGGGGLFVGAFLAFHGRMQARHAVAAAVVMSLVLYLLLGRVLGLYLHPGFLLS
jgi:hypothetical protein